MYPNNSFSSAEPFTSFYDEDTKIAKPAEEKNEFENKKKKTFRVILIFLAVFAGVLILLSVVFGGLYGSALQIVISGKKNFSESCLTAQCNDALSLACINEICACNGNTYWNGYSCATYP